MKAGVGSRLTALRPPHGWIAVGWELAIVVIGVLIALGAQQWATDRSDRQRGEAALDALRDELAVHYSASVEWRLVEPCIRTQIDRLAGRVLASGATLDTAPAYSEPGFDFFVLRMPSRNYQDGIWRAVLADGATAQLPAATRNELNYHYRQIGAMAAMTDQNNSDYQRLFVLSRPIPLDADVRASLLQQLDGLRGRAELFSFFSAQLLRHIERLGMVPPQAALKAQSGFGTYRFCRAHGLPVRSLRDAMRSADT